MAKRETKKDLNSKDYQCVEESGYERRNNKFGKSIRYIHQDNGTRTRPNTGTIKSRTILGNRHRNKKRMFQTNCYNHKTILKCRHT